MAVGRESFPRNFTGRLGVEKIRTSRSVPCVYVSIPAGFSFKTGEGGERGGGWKDTGGFAYLARSREDRAQDVCT